MTNSAAGGLVGRVSGDALTDAVSERRFRFWFRQKSSELILLCFLRLRFVTTPYKNLTHLELKHASLKKSTVPQKKSYWKIVLLRPLLPTRERWKIVLLQPESGIE
jgi:hypothetical protein